MKRRLFNLLTAISLVICVAALTLWVRSYWVADIFKFSGDCTTSVMWSRGGLRLVGVDLSSRPERQNSEPYRRMNPFNLSSLPPGPGWGKVGMLSQFKAGGFSWHHSAGGIYVSPAAPFNTTWLPPAWELIIPLWVPAVLFGLLPVRRAFRLRRWAFDPTHCRACGYDLRATPDRCPECGTANPSPPIQGAAA